MEVALPGGIFPPILALGSYLRPSWCHLCQSWACQSEQFSICHSGNEGYFGAISKAPLTAMILVTEMVGDIRNLMPLGLVTLVAYCYVDLLKEHQSMRQCLEKCCQKKRQMKEKSPPLKSLHQIK